MKLVEPTAKLVCRIMKLSLHFCELILPKGWEQSSAKSTAGNSWFHVSSCMWLNFRWKPWVGRISGPPSSVLNRHSLNWKLPISYYRICNISARKGTRSRFAVRDLINVRWEWWWLTLQIFNYLTKLSYIVLNFYNDAYNGSSTCYNLIQWNMHGQNATSTSHEL
jgi:hypothetical protein